MNNDKEHIKLFIPGRLGIQSAAESIERQACCNYGSQQKQLWYAERQLHLRQILTHIGALPLGKPEVLVARAEQVFNAEGKLVDPATGGYHQDLLTTPG